MAGTLKAFFSPALVRRLAADITRVFPEFDSRAFVKRATTRLEELELIDRAKHIAAAVTRHLPEAYPAALDVLLSSVGPEHEDDELLGVGMGPFYYYPHLVFIAEHGLDHFDLSLQAQYEFTKRFTAEFSMRAYIARDPERTFATLLKWAADPNAHVRRLVSECTRVRLPWATRVPWLDAHPERVLELLDVLKDDHASMVRRSVANNLNDLGKTHNELLIATCRRWLEAASSQRRALVEHALRSAVKRGDKAALKLLGFGTKASVAIEDVSFEPRRVAIGGRVRVRFVLRSTSRSAQEVLVDLAIHFVKAGGKTLPKVFKLKRVSLAPRARVELQTSISLAVHTTRKPRAGKHAVDVAINGELRHAGSFVVIAAR